MADTMLRIVRKRIATAPVGPRNDSSFVMFCADFGADFGFSCHCEEPPKGGDAAIRIPCIRRMLSPHRGDNFQLQQCDKL